MNYLEKLLDTTDGNFIEEMLKHTPGSDAAKKAKNEILELIG